MRALVTRRPDQIPALKVRVIQLQERAAKLARERNVEEARRVRGKLIVLLNQLDILKEEAK
jgi:hypothetical protein